MLYHMKLSKDYIPEIRKLLSQGLCDREIGEALGGFTKNQICNFRVRNGIEAKRGPGARKGERRGYYTETIEPLRQIIENGVRITLCPRRWATGIWPQKNLRQRD